MIGDRIVQIRGKIARNDFAQELNIHPSSLARYEKGERLPDSACIGALIEKYNVSAEWLILGKGEQHGSSDPSVREKSASSDGKTQEKPNLTKAPSPLVVCGKECDVDLVCIPRVTARLSAGNGSLLTSSEYIGQYAFRSDWINKKGTPTSMVILGVSGTSMQPEIYDNDIVMIDQSQKEIIAGKIYAVGVDEMVLVKYIDAEPGKIILRSKNPEYNPIEVDTKDQSTIRILGRVVWSSREY